MSQYLVMTGYDNFYPYCHVQSLTVKKTFNSEFYFAVTVSNLSKYIEMCYKYININETRRNT